MKALFLRTDFYGHLTVGGSFSHTKGFLEGLVKNGHDYIAVSSGDLPADKNRFIHVPYSGFYRNLPEVLSLAYNYRLFRRLPPILAAEQPDFIYHRHSEFNYASSVIRKNFSLPLVLEFNGSELWVKKHWGKAYLTPLLRWAENIQLHGADIIAVVSEVIKEDLLRLGVEPDRILVNPNGVDTEVFRPNLETAELVRNHRLEGKTIACFVGTFGQWHGVEVLARAVRLVVAKNRNIHILMIGDGKLRGEVERILTADGVADAVTLTGTVNYDLVPRYLAASDILLSPHVHNADGSTFFGSPTKLFEYMASGRAIVASPVGQIGTVLQDSKNALLMKEGDPADLAEKMLVLAENSRLRESLGKQAREDAVRKHSWEINAKNVVEAITPFVHHRETSTN